MELNNDEIALIKKAFSLLEVEFILGNIKDNNKVLTLTNLLTKLGL